MVPLTRPVGGCLLDYASRWSLITSDQLVLDIVLRGYSLTFSPDGPPALSRVPVAFTPPRDPMRLQLLVQAAEKMLALRAVELVSNPASPGFYSRLFLVPKKTGGLRPVIDLSILNKFLHVPTFKMETTASIMAVMRPNEWTTSIDLQDAYFHIPIAVHSRKYLRFMILGRVYQFRALPFGVASAPLIFTRVMGVVANYAHRHGVRVHMYLDDWLLRSLSRTTLLRDTQFLMDLCVDLGLRVNVSKSSLIPQQDFVFLGIRFMTVPFLCYPSEDRFQRLQVLLRGFLRRPALSAKMWMRVIGSLTSMTSQVPLGALHRRPVQLWFLAHWRHPRLLLQSIPVGSSVRQALRWWTVRSHVMIGASLSPFNPQVTMYSDASLSGWGAHLDSLTASDSWPPRYRSYAINWLELKAIHLALGHFLPQLRDHHVLWMCDNRTAVAYINKQGGTRSQSLYVLARDILLLCRTANIRLRCRYVPGNLNVHADRLSRRGQILATEWSLHPRVTSALWLLWGRPHVDLFATRENFKLPTFVSPLPDEMAWASNAFTISWEGMKAYAYPPTSLIPRVLAKLRLESAEVILVAPWLPRRAWSLDLLDLCLEAPRALPAWSTLLLQPGSDIFHRNPGVLRLHAWRVSRAALLLPDSQRGWRRELPEGNFDPLL